ncbi:MAG TPA: AAA family ATPase [Solirubrobacteraceae bacterium]|nr:AAA family ATPase [Solirubrobacteraceae bacterium]
MGLLVGRARELEQLESALRRAQSGVGATILVAGDAGIGKTRLLGELAERARAAGAQVLTGRGIDLIGAELPFLPLVEALRPVGELPHDANLSRLRLFEELLELLTRLSRSAPVLLVLDDLHWADDSTVDAVAFLAHNIADRRIVLVAAFRPEIERLPEGLVRAGTLVELGPLAPDEVAAALAALRPERSPAALMDIAERSEGNPFFAEELLAASVHEGTLPPVLRTVLLQRIAQLDQRCQDVLRIAAAAGRDVPYRLLEAVVDLDEAELQAALRRAVEHGVLIADQESARFRFRHALLADAVYGTLVPGEREHLHQRLGEALADDAEAAELAHHWAAAGRASEALAASARATHEAKAMVGFAEALRHAERVITLWDQVPDAEERAGMDLARALEEAAELALLAGDAPRATALSDRALAMLDDRDVVRAGLLHHQRTRYLWAATHHEQALASQQRAVELVPAEPPSAARANVLAGLAHILMLHWQHEESLAAAEEAVPMARAVGERRAEMRALGVLGTDLAYLGEGERGVAHLREALQLAHESGVPEDAYRAYALLSDALTMLGRWREGADAALEGRDATARLGIERGLGAVLAANACEALFALGEWDAAAAVAERALARGVEVQRYAVLGMLAAVEVARGDLDAAAARLDEAAGPAAGDARSALQHAAFTAELALVQGDPAAARERLDWALAEASAADAALRRAELCTLALRADADRAALDRRAAESREDADATLATARAAADAAAAVTPLAAGWRALAEAEHTRVAGPPQPEAWLEAAATWDRLEVPYRAAYCRYRQAEALVAAGASRLAGGVPAREAHAVAVRLGAAPLQRELELLAERARLDLSPPEAPAAPEGELGLTPREREVLDLIARGLTNREIAAELVISTKTAAIHVSNILRKLDVPTRVEAAAIAQRLEPR